MVSRSGRARLAGVGSGHPSDRALHRGLRDGRRFVETAERCRKPIVALKTGKGRAGARVAASHTGSLAGRHGAVQAALARAGVVEAATSDEFFDSLQSLGAGRLVAGRSDAVLTIWGGPGVLASDAAERLGLCLPPPGEATARRIRELAPEFAAAGNLIDLTGLPGRDCDQLRPGHRRVRPRRRRRTPAQREARDGIRVRCAEHRIPAGGGRHPDPTQPGERGRCLRPAGCPEVIMLTEWDRKALAQ